MCDIPQATAIDGNQKMLWATVVVCEETPMPMASATTPTIVWEYDDCGICNGPGAIYECGCADIPVGDCDCDGNQLDALGVCGGDCTADADVDGICDDVDDWSERTTSAAS